MDTYYEQGQPRRGFYPPVRMLLLLHSSQHPNQWVVQRNAQPAYNISSLCVKDIPVEHLNRLGCRIDCRWEKFVDHMAPISGWHILYPTIIKARDANDIRKHSVTEQHTKA